jgi:Flp pilus assembly protein TadD
MTRLQWIFIGLTVLLFFVLYFGCETKDKTIAALEKTRALQAESTDISLLLQDAHNALAPADEARVGLLEQELEAALADSTRNTVFKKLSSTWFELGQYALAGYYAQEVAQLDQNEEAWSIAGTTYTICLQRSQDEQIRSFCSGRAVAAFESAISLNPNEPRHRVNLALCYAESPPADNPMKGIQMLLDLNQKDPNNVLVLNTLGRLAIRTGQYDKAVERLQKANELAPENVNTVCLLAQAYEGQGDAAKAQAFDAQCRARLN